jgi:hypothetical protein
MYNIENAKKVLKALIDAGAKTSVLPFLMAQVAHETGDFDSNVFRDNNNASGIMFINKPTKQKNAKRGRAFPKNEGNYFYAHFNTLKDWAVDYLRIIGNLPLQATSLNDYAQRLKARKYYTASTSLYAKALNAHFEKLKNINLISNTSNVSNSLLSIFVVALLGAGVYLFTTK